jgi:hypothetical protein
LESAVAVRSAASDFDDGLSPLIVPALVVARLGEADHRGWWRSNGASPTGAFVLEHRFPRTHRVLGLEIALVAAERRHREEFGDQDGFVHLFSSVLGAARLVRAWLAERKTESAEVELIAELHSASTAELEKLIPPAGEARTGVPFGSRVRIGEIARGALEEPNERAQAVGSLARACIDGPPGLPYLEVSIP